MTDDEFHRETRHRIWLSAYACNNPRFDYNWQTDALYNEWGRHGKPERYSAAYEEEYHMLLG